MNLDQLRDSDPWTWEIVAAKPRVAARPRRSSARQWTGKVRSRRGSHPSTALTSTATNGRRPLAMMMPRPTDGNPQARRITSARPATIRAPRPTA